MPAQLRISFLDDHQDFLVFRLENSCQHLAGAPACVVNSGPWASSMVESGDLKLLMGNLTRPTMAGPRACRLRALNTGSQRKALSTLAQKWAPVSGSCRRFPRISGGTP